MGISDRAGALEQPDAAAPRAEDCRKVRRLRRSAVTAIEYYGGPGGGFIE
jgi:hypothetical protein